MIKKLRIRFIAIAMASVFLVLGAIVFAINVADFARVRGDADEVLRFLAANGGQFRPDTPPEQGQEPDQSGENVPPAPPDGDDGGRRGGINAETPYETRFFTVVFNADGTSKVNTQNVVRVSDEQALKYANAVANGKTTKGYVGDYRYLATTNVDGDKTVLFVDCQRSLSNARAFLTASLAVSAGGLAVVFLMVFFLSGRVVAPIAESYEKQKRFITDAGHELKTPLTIISANNELVEMTSGESQYTQVIAKQVERMNVMVKNMTALARLDEDGKVDKQVFCLSDVASEVADSFAGAFARDGKTFTVSVEEGVDVCGNEALLRQLASIFLDNAVKYSVGFARFSVKKSGKHAELCVVNDCEGMPKGSCNGVFERFYRSDSARASDRGGSGIGLSIAKEIVDLHGGAVSAAVDEQGNFIVKALI